MGYIEKEAARLAVMRAGCIENILPQLEALPAADVVPVVRCKDCKHRVDWHEDGYSEDAGMCIATINHLVAPNHFCSYGERKEGEG